MFPIQTATCHSNGGDKTEIRPIETIYNGYRFRSRLEAKWAVFFDSAGIEYEYEPQGYELPDGRKYLPDFYLINVYPRFSNYRGIWLEVKGALSDEDYSRISIFSGDYDTDKNLKERPIIIVGQIPKSCYDVFFDVFDNRLFNFNLVDGDNYTGFFYKTDSRIELQGFDNVDSLKGFEHFNNALLKARQARFEHGEKPQL